MSRKKQQKEQTPLTKAESKIRLCAAMGFLSAGLTFLFSILTLSDISVMGYTKDTMIFNIIEGAFIAVFGFGIIKKSRICAILLFAHFCFGKIFVLIRDLNYATSLVVPILFWGSIYWGGITGTFAYHKLKAEALDLEQA